MSRRLYSRRQHDFDTSVLPVAEFLLEVGTIGERSTIDDHNGRIDITFLNQLKKPGQIVLDRCLCHSKVRPRLIADPMGLLSRMPP